MRTIRPGWTAAAYLAMLSVGTALFVALDAERVFQYVTYVPAFAGVATAVAAGLLLLGRTDPLPKRWVTLTLAGLTAVVLICLSMAPTLPTSHCKAFYAAQRRLKGGMPVEAAHQALRSFDGSPPYVPSPGWVSFRCQSDPSTVDYVMVRIAEDGTTIERLDYLLD